MGQIIFKFASIQNWKTADMGKGVSKNPKNMPTSFMYGPYIVPVLIVGKSFPSFLNGWLYLNFQVVTLCAMLWSLPRIWVYYGTYIFPYWSSFLLPMVQISIMSSVYCTIVMSWERYVRICLGLCIWRSVVPSFKNIVISKIHIFWEGHKILRNLHLTFDWHYIAQK